METRAIMRRYALLLLLLASLWASRAQAQSERVVLVLTATGPPPPAMIESLDRGLLLAERRGAEALVLQLDPPGGQIDHMNQMVQSIRASAVPVVVYVSPRGAWAASAGTVITLAGHVAAMAPETVIGAASPVGGQGEDLGETLEEKVKEVLKADVRGLAERRGVRPIFYRTNPGCADQPQYRFPADVDRLAGDPDRNLQPGRLGGGYDRCG